MNNKIIAAIAVLISGLLTVSCEKESTNGYLPHRPIVGFDPENRPPGYLRYYSSEAKLRDTVYMETYALYLWQDQLPGTFPTHHYLTAEGVLNELKTYAKDGNGRPLDRFSFLDRSGTVNQEIQQGQHVGGFGFEVRYQNETDLYLKKVDLGSPAYQGGLRRGWQIVKINGRTDLSIAAMEQDDYAFLFQSIYGQSIDLRLRKPDGSEVDLSLQSRPYNIHPVLAHRIVELGPHKIGYLAFDIFVSNALIEAQMESILNQFASQGVKNLILDLRYNGGGNVATAAYVGNLLAPASANHQLMFSYRVNQHLINMGWDQFVFQKEYFNKKNSLALDRVYFLVTGSTASASELLINNLKPYMEVHVIGDGRTFGKPVGYFGWEIMGVDLYAVSFQTFNGVGEGDYFDGLPIDQYAKDDVSRDFGDPAEEMTSVALQHILTGSFPAPGLTSGTEGGSGFSTLGLRSLSARGPGETGPGETGPGNRQGERNSLNEGIDRRLRRPHHGAMFNFGKIDVPLRH